MSNETRLQLVWHKSQVRIEKAYIKSHSDGEIKGYID
jgi:hypothetical protein